MDNKAALTRYPIGGEAAGRLLRTSRRVSVGNQNSAEVIFALFGLAVAYSG